MRALFTIGYEGLIHETT